MGGASARRTDAVTVRLAPVAERAQRTLEGVHELTVAFAVPANWRGDAVRVHPRFLELRAYLWERIRTMKIPA